MKTRCLSIILLAISLVSFSAFSQSETEPPLLGLPGDDLDLYAVLDLFQKSKTIEDFEKSLNDEKDGIVNLDLNNDGKVDFIKVVTDQEGEDFLFILQDLVSEKETQDVAVIIVAKDSAGKVSMQIIGDQALYGADYVIEPLSEARESVTANPAYTGSNPVTVNVEASTKIVVVQTAPIVQYVYSPVYVPYYPTYYYGFYPPYWRPWAVVSIGIYRHNHWHYHGGYHGGYYGRPPGGGHPGGGHPGGRPPGGPGHTTVNINNSKTYNNYNNNKRNTSATVNNNVRNGNFKTSGQAGSRPTTSQNTRVSNGASTYNRASNTSNTQARTSNRASTTNSRPTTTTANRATTLNNNSRATTSRATTSNVNRSSASRTMGSSSRSATSSVRARQGRLR